jgi:hypothetical protein
LKFGIVLACNMQTMLFIFTLPPVRGAEMPAGTSSRAGSTMNIPGSARRQGIGRHMRNCALPIFRWREVRLRGFINPAVTTPSASEARLLPADFSPQATSWTMAHWNSP